MFCSHCGKELVAQANFCSSCGAALSNPGIYTRARIVRPRSPRMIAGVCSGFAIHYGWDLTVVRILFSVITFFTSGLGILVYIAAWILIPDALYTLPPAPAPQPPMQSVQS